jgi:RNA polymerase sigma-70 factor (ECF subfamily)
VAALGEALQDAYTAFVTENGDRALRLAYVTLRHRTEAEDVAQEAFYRLWRHCLRHGVESLSTALLYQTVVNLCRDRMRYHHRHPEDAVDPQELFGTAPLGPDREQAMAVGQAVEALKPLEQQVILLFYYLDHSLKDTAQILGLSEQMVKTRLYRARQHLRPLLEPVIREEVD